MYAAVAMLFFFFNVPEDYYFAIFMLLTIITLPVLLSMQLFPLKLNLFKLYDCIKRDYQYKQLFLLFGLVVILFGPLDIYVNGFKLLNPSTYAEFNGGGRYIRHITILCWTLIPIAFLYLRNPLAKLFFISYAIIFPILIIDRNRLFISFYSLFLCIVLTYSSTTSERTKLVGKLMFCALPLICFLIFSLLGKFRSNTGFIVESSGTYLQEGFYPLKDTFINLPRLLQQIVLYVTTPIFNFSTVAAADFFNQDFLLSQISPFNRDSFDAYPYSPILVPRFNVGTEFYPFLLYGGLPMVLGAYVFLLLTFIGVIYLLKKHPNIFTLFIFIKISYSALFMGFAPQFFILLNLMFVMMMLFLWFFSRLLIEATTNPGLIKQDVYQYW